MLWDGISYLLLTPPEYFRLVFFFFLISFIGHIMGRHLLPLFGPSQIFSASFTRHIMGWHLLVCLLPFFLALPESWILNLPDPQLDFSSSTSFWHPVVRQLLLVINLPGQGGQFQANSSLTRALEWFSYDCLKICQCISVLITLPGKSKTIRRPNWMTTKFKAMLGGEEGLFTLQQRESLFLFPFEEARLILLDFFQIWFEVKEGDWHSKKQSLLWKAGWPLLWLLFTTNF